MAKLLTVLNTWLYLITKYNKRFRGSSITLSSDFMQLPLLDDILTKVAL